MPASQMQLLGLCRFSYPTSDGSGFSVTEGVNALSRLKARLELFKRLWLPSVSGQTDKRFSIVVLTGSSLPDEIRKQILQAVSNCPQIHVHEEPDGQPHNEVCHKVFTLFRDPLADIVGEFGLDDDDAVSLDFVAEVYKYAATVEQLIDTDGRAELDFSRGYAAQVDADEIQLKEVISPHWNCGQVIFQRLPSRLSLFNFHHYRFWKRHPCLLAAQRPMFVRTFHSSNDSGDRWNKFRAEVSSTGTDEQVAVLQERFGIQLTSDDQGKLRFR